MPHPTQTQFAEIAADRKILRVIIVPIEVAYYGAAWCAERYGGTWVDVTGKNAGVGYSHDQASGDVMPPRPFASWSWDGAAKAWKAPTPAPSKDSEWIEATQSWRLATPVPLKKS